MCVYQVCETEKVSLLIDDSVENAVECAQCAPVLLFGDYVWNRRFSSADHPDHFLSHAQRLVKFGGYPWWEDEVLGDLPSNVVRVSNWLTIVQQVPSNEAMRLAVDQG